MNIDEDKLDEVLSKYSEDDTESEPEESEAPVIEDNVPEVVKDPTAIHKQVEKFTEASGNIIQQNYVDGKKNMHDTIKDIAHLQMGAKALDDSDENNKKFIEESVSKTQEALKQSFQSSVYEEEARKLEAKKKKAEAFYTMFRPILEFDFSNLRKVKKIRLNPAIKKKGREDAPAYEYRIEEPKTYADRSYGIPLMVLMLCLLTIPYCVVTIILSIANAINEIFMQIANYGKPALIICSSLAGITLIGLVVYIILLVVQSAFGVVIFR